MKKTAFAALIIQDYFMILVGGKLKEKACIRCSHMQDYFMILVRGKLKEKACIRCAHNAGLFHDPG